MNWHVGAHASTFGGNPVAIAAALKTLEILENGVMSNAQELGQYIMTRLSEMKDRHNAIADVRGLGLMIGIELTRDRETQEPWQALRDKVLLECFNRGLVVQGAGESAIRFSPPLIIDREQADFALEAFEGALMDSL
jgi:4-aminobutyrate aminotransferase